MLREQRIDLAIELGPHPTLLSFVGAVFADEGPARVASMRKGERDSDVLLDALASAYLAGARIDWRAQMADGPGPRPRLTDLPAYPFQRERYWFQARPMPAREQAPVPGSHRLLGRRVRHAGTARLYEAMVGADQPAFVREHRVQGRVVLPATAYLDILQAAARSAAAAQTWWWRTWRSGKPWCWATRAKRGPCRPCASRCRTPPGA
ncbi:hypothetical protein FSC37_09645 [Piscinibacter aquaticus]|uniref:Polyketide synthase dehydratase domain-containing protein n=1 Tax=Piscinibacter aquaticus TaxID=392597 RepID=A0A5C6U0N1_9BURK|nr:hypothetical protein FSC37_09645 [Piscinibacter aquaticus]